MSSEGKKVKFDESSSLNDELNKVEDVNHEKTDLNEVLGGENSGEQGGGDENSENDGENAPQHGVTPTDIVKIVEKSFLTYSLSVIIDRALPDVRDGLKPVHRRIIYAMKKLNITAGGSFYKCARVVGDVMGKYHPHGDMAIYDALVRMAQSWSLRYELVHGQGNFGSIDGDGPASMRYTECKMRKLTEAMLRDIEKETVDFRKNYDGREEEPTVLPAAFPNLLVNGVTGIAVGMATNMPPHNLREVITACVMMLKNPEVGIEELIEIVNAPDFPTGGTVYNKKEIAEAYRTGRGRVTMRGTASIDDAEKKPKIIFTEIPYQTNKSKIVEKIAELVRDKKIMGITDLRDETSSREGMRIVVELARDAYPQKILNQLYKMTDLQCNFNFNMIALTNGGVKPHLFNLQELVAEFVAHRIEVMMRRCEFELRRAKAREHILEGLMIAVGNIDEIVKIIKGSKDVEVARAELRARFKLSEIQAEAILEMKLRKLSGLERQKIEDELKEVRAEIARLEEILGSEAKLKGVIIDELEEISEKHGDERRTKVVVHGIGEFREEDLIADEQALVMLTKQGYVKRMQPDVFRAQHRGGKGVKGMNAKEDDAVLVLLTVKTHDEVLFFTTRGRVFRVRAYEIPEASRTARGTAVQNLINIEKGEEVSAVLSV